MMTQVCCPICRLRFTPAAAMYLVACPQCGEPPQLFASLERTVGFRLFEPEHLLDSARTPQTASLATPSNYVEASPTLSHRAATECHGLLRLPTGR